MSNHIYDDVTQEDLFKIENNFTREELETAESESLIPNASTIRESFCHHMPKMPFVCSSASTTDYNQFFSNQLSSQDLVKDYSFKICDDIMNSDQYTLEYKYKCLINMQSSLAIYKGSYVLKDSSVVNTIDSKIQIATDKLFTDIASDILNNYEYSYNKYDLSNLNLLEKFSSKINSELFYKGYDVETCNSIIKYAEDSLTYAKFSNFFSSSKDYSSNISKINYNLKSAYETLEYKVASKYCDSIEYVLQTNYIPIISKPISESFIEKLSFSFKNSCQGYLTEYQMDKKISQLKLFQEKVEYYKNNNHSKTFDYFGIIDKNLYIAADSLFNKKGEYYCKNIDKFFVDTIKEPEILTHFSKHLIDNISKLENGDAKKQLELINKIQDHVQKYIDQGFTKDSKPVIKNIDSAYDVVLKNLGKYYANNWVEFAVMSNSQIPEKLLAYTGYEISLNIKNNVNSIYDQVAQIESYQRKMAVYLSEYNIVDTELSESINNYVTNSFEYIDDNLAYSYFKDPKSFLQDKEINHAIFNKFIDKIDSDINLFLDNNSLQQIEALKEIKIISDNLDFIDLSQRLDLIVDKIIPKLTSQYCYNPELFLNEDFKFPNLTYAFIDKVYKNIDGMVDCKLENQVKLIDDLKDSLSKIEEDLYNKDKISELNFKLDKTLTRLTEGGYYSISNTIYKYVSLIKKHTVGF